MPGCQRPRCDRHIGRLWALKQKRRLLRRLARQGGIMDAFARCVAFKESSSNPTYDDGTYHGLYNFDHETWQAAGGGRYAYDANEATVAEQTAVFHYWYRGHPEAWPQTGPACGGA